MFQERNEETLHFFDWEAEGATKNSLINLKTRLFLVMDYSTATWSRNLISMQC